MGCGAAFLDYDNDGWLDIIVLTGRRSQATPEGAIIRLYRNNRDGTFSDVTREIGPGRSVWATGITVGDYDNDGFDDVFITCWGQNLLFHNNGNGTFTDVTEKAGLTAPGSALRHGLHLDRLRPRRPARSLRFALHGLRSGEDSAARQGPRLQLQWRPGLLRARRACRRKAAACTTTTATAHSRDVSEKSGIAAVKPGYALTAVAADFDGDGWPDIYVACDTSPSLFFRNNHDGTFTEEGLERGVSLSEDGQEQAGMGLGIGDVERRRIPGYLQDAFSRRHRGALSQQRQGLFPRRDAAGGSGGGDAIRRLGRGHRGPGQRRPSRYLLLDRHGLSRSGTEDSRRSLQDAERAVPQSGRRASSKSCWRRPGRASAEAHSSRGVAFGDFDNDGDIDILVVNMNEPPSLLRNDVSGRRPLAQGAAGGDGLEPQRDRRAGGRLLRGAETGAGSAGAVFVSFGE